MNKANLMGFNFAKTLTILVMDNIYPILITEEMKKTKLDDCFSFHLWVEYIPRILMKWRIEMYFLMAEELSLFKKYLNDESFKELIQELKEDFRCEKFNPEEFLCFSILVSFYAVIAMTRNCRNARKVAVRAIYDNIQHFEALGELTENTWKTVLEVAKKIAIG
ncbi:hypothetical protein NPIL_2771 [Nephila pilipes]|uniref:Uncharacterized protein n=1 Tax=Nephila pilipes TaxID=299642 RepID=A0A8X6P1P9_NEPPI|nr:hypothetical protein NPIL_2771 [Nephila pilipes]